MSKLIETRADFQLLAEARLVEAKALLDIGKWGGSYYLGGYAVELALKACIMKALMATDAFTDKKIFTELLHALARKAPRTGAIGGPTQDCGEGRAKPAEELAARAEHWSEEKRYHLIDQTEAEEFYFAVADAVHGVFSWIKTQW